MAEISFTDYATPTERVVLDTHVWLGYLDRHSFAQRREHVRVSRGAGHRELERERQEIMDESAALDAESAEVLENIKGLP